MTQAANGSRPRSDSIIGAHMRIDGNVDFAGSVRIHGSVHGDVTGAGDSESKAVVAESGTVVGTIRAANIVVQGRADGYLVSDRTIEIFPSGRCTGGAQYNALSIREGGVIDGVLQLSSSIEVARPRKSPRAAVARSGQVLPGNATALADDTVTVTTDTPAELPALRPPGSSVPARRSRAVLWVGAAAIATVAVAWALRGPKTPEPEPVRPLASAPTVPSEQSSTSHSPSSSTLPLASSAPTPLPPPATAASKPTAPAAVTAPSPPPSRAVSLRADDSGGRVIAIEGTNADKPAGAFFVITREAAVIHRKKRDAAGEGMRIEVARGRNLSLQVAGDEIVRVAAGRDLDVYFQGRKVPPTTVETGSWISFVPASRPAPTAAPEVPAAVAAPAAPAAGTPAPAQ